MGSDGKECRKRERTGVRVISWGVEKRGKAIRIEYEEKELQGEKLEHILKDGDSRNHTLKGMLTCSLSRVPGLSTVISGYFIVFALVEQPF